MGKRTVGGSHWQGWRCPKHSQHLAGRPGATWANLDAPFGPNNALRARSRLPDALYLWPPGKRLDALQHEDGLADK